MKPSSRKPVPASDGDLELCFVFTPQQRMCSLSLPAKHWAELRVSAAWGVYVHRSACLENICVLACASMSAPRAFLYWRYQPLCTCSYKLIGLAWSFKKAAVKGFCVSQTCRLLMAPCSAFWGVLMEGIRVITCTEELLEGILLPQMISCLLVKQPRGTGIGCWCYRRKQYQVPLTCWEQILKDAKVWLMRI